MLKNIYFIAVLLFICGCSSSVKDSTRQGQLIQSSEVKKPKGYEGVLKDSLYTNASVPMVMKFPKGWYIRDNVDKSKLTLIGGQSQDVVVKPLLRKTSRLFYISKYNTGRPGKPNPSISANVFHILGNEANAEKHNAQIKESLIKAKVFYEFPELAFNEKIAGVKYNVLSAKVDIQGVTIYQKYYTTKIGNQMLSFLMTYNSDVQLANLSSLLGGVRYQK